MATVNGMNTETLIGHHISAMGSPAPVTRDIAWLQTGIVNVFFVSNDDGSWVLVDAGMPRFARRIRNTAEDLYRRNPTRGASSSRHTRPRAIILTHGHFDHVGCIDLADEWDVPVYAHELELPYLTGRSDYPPPDPTVGGGLMARSAMLYPHSAIDIGHRVQPLPGDGSIPGMPQWRWIHTPGHTPGHISLFREDDRTLIAGDAFCTQKQESAVAVMTNYRQVHGPPMYFNADWVAAGESVRTLAALRPSVAGTGHGIPMRGRELAEQLSHLASNFERLALPRNGRYVGKPARADRDGVTYVPPPVPDPLPRIVAGVALAGLVAAIVATTSRSDDHRRST